MLVLSRKTAEGIRIGDDVEVIVVAVQGDRVRIGIRAPREIAVHREEVYQARLASEATTEATAATPAR